MIERARGGDALASEAIRELTHEALHVSARALMRRQSPAPGLSVTSLLNEAHARLLRHAGSWESRAHFVATANRAMRSILADCAARKTRRDRRTRDADATRASDTALRGLADVAPRVARVLQLRYFAGLSVPDVAKHLDASVRSIERDLRFGRRWLAATGDELRHIVGIGTLPDFEFAGPGVRVASVIAASPAAAAGIETGDVILAIDGADVADLRAYSAILKAKKPGDVVKVRLRRGDAEREVEAKLGAR